jgi:hypothetical protein
MTDRGNRTREVLPSDTFSGRSRARAHRPRDRKPETPEPVIRAITGSIRASPVLGGLHHVYQRVA